MEEKIHYKIVKTDFDSDGKKVYKSCSMVRSGVIYRVGEFVSRPLTQGFGPLAVFDSLQNAIRFLENYDLSIYIYYVFICEIIPSEDKKLWNDVKSLSVEKLPFGTVLADRVKLINKVSNREIESISAQLAYHSC